MRLLIFLIVCWAFVVPSRASFADLPSDFLDKPQDTLTTQKSETHSKKYHKVDLDRAETVNDDKVSKYKTTTLDSMTSTDSEVTTTMNPTELPDSEVTSTKAADSISTTEMTTNAETTTDASPTTGKIATSTEVAKTSTNSSTNVIPSSPGRHRLTWILGGLFFAMLVMVLSLYTYRFYKIRSESSYQNL